jgi:rhodanese-related sulfurtransferase
MFSNIDPARLQQLLDAPDAPRLVDVRTAAEVARGAIAGATHIELSTVPGRLVELDPGHSYVVYCQAGGRSAQACAFLAQRGFGRLYNLEGGIAAWVRAGLPVTAPA